VEQKQQILRAAFEPGASVARVAREHEVNANQVFKWMKLRERGLLVDRRSQNARLLPVRIAEEPAAAALVTAPVTPSGSIRIEIAGKAVLTAEAGDEHTRESLLVRAERSWSSARVISALADVMVMKGVPEHLRSDNVPEFVAKDLGKWLAATGAQTLYIEPGSAWENGYCESFNSKLRDEFLNGEIFYSKKELRVLAERWRVHYNTLRPHSSLGYRSPAPQAWLTNNTGHGEVETLRASHFSTPPTPAT
jgi:transposase InsO family protein